jgi:anti-sigma regulatory factor (Ser/Thr protein kinase)
MKKRLKTLDATPPKEIYRSIIVDYDLKLGVSELVDNALDIWTQKGSNDQLDIQIELDTNQQKITIIDNAGGIGEDNLLNFISPGRTGNTAKEETIGIFGVGSKRAVVALAQEIKVSSRKGNGKTISLEFNDNWLIDESWDIEAYEVDNIPSKTTQIELLGLRSKLDDDEIERLKDHLSSTYALFLKNGKLKILVNKAEVEGVEYDSSWSFPPDYPPQKFNFRIPVEDQYIKIEILGGLLSEKESGGGESGVYFYCNQRLIARALKDYEVGYSKGYAGQPHHPGAALGRVIVKLQGQAQFMPWNSSKSAINYKHKVFEALRESIMDVLKYFVSLSRRTQGDWPNQVYKFDKGMIEVKTISTPSEVSNLYNIPLPRQRKRYDEKLLEKNKTIGKRKPWTVGLYEAIGLVDFIISKKGFSQRNRFALIMLDSNLEIALKEYLVNESGIGMSKFNSIVGNRTSVIAEVQNKLGATTIDSNDWQRINYYYLIRNNLVHQRTTAAVSDTEVIEFRELVEKVLKELFGLKF